MRNKLRSLFIVLALIAGVHPALVQPTLSIAPAGMALIPAGMFTMGNSIGDSDITDAATVTANVSAFYMDTNLVSYSQLARIKSLFACGFGLSETFKKVLSGSRAVCRRQYSQCKPPPI
jgi:hypothetical protein